MARTTPKILEWGTPPAPKPTGWDAIGEELQAHPGDWANVGTLTTVAAKRLTRDRFTAEAGFGHRLVPVDGETGKVVLWLRHEATPDAKPGRKPTATAS